MSWVDGDLIALDTETTGVDVESDRIVTASIVSIERADGLKRRESRTSHWLIDPGVPIPAQATAVHGITTEHARQNGQRPVPALAAMTEQLAEVLTLGVPVVAMNAPFDLTILDRECRRRGVAPVVDPMVIDRQHDPYRRGPRTLTALCAHYRVALDEAHASWSDALAAARLVWRLARVHPHLAGMTLADLHAAQVEWKREQAASLRDYWQQRGDPRAAKVDGAWPWKPAPSLQGARL